MAVVRRFALGLVRANKGKRSVKTRRKSAGWNPGYLLQMSVNLDSLPCTRIAIRRGNYLRDFACRFMQLCVPTIKEAEIRTASGAEPRRFD